LAGLIETRLESRNDPSNRTRIPTPPEGVLPPRTAVATTLPTEQGFQRRSTWEQARRSGRNDPSNRTRIPTRRLYRSRWSSRSQRPFQQNKDSNAVIRFEQRPYSVSQRPFQQNKDSNTAPRPALLAAYVATTLPTEQGFQHGTEYTDDRCLARRNDPSNRTRIPTGDHLAPSRTPGSRNDPSNRTRIPTPRVRIHRAQDRGRNDPSNRTRIPTTVP